MSRPTLRTAFCERVGIEYPIVLAGMGPVAGTGEPVATPELVAAVSNAGGLGVMGGVAYAPDVLRRRAGGSAEARAAHLGVGSRATHHADRCPSPRSEPAHSSRDLEFGGWRRRE
jgi:NAD(P)H-dependent flavin oxidoreductase YrpB (nitropropane dioxygenase family)